MYGNGAMLASHEVMIEMESRYRGEDLVHIPRMADQDRPPEPVPRALPPQGGDPEHNHKQQRERREDGAREDKQPGQRLVPCSGRWGARY